MNTYSTIPCLVIYTKECLSAQHTYISHEFIPKQINKGQLYYNMKISQILIMARSNILPSEVKTDNSQNTLHNNRKPFKNISISNLTLTLINTHHLGEVLQFIGTQKDNI